MCSSRRGAAWPARMRMDGASVRHGVLCLVPRASAKNWLKHVKAKESVGVRTDLTYLDSTPWDVISAEEMNITYISLWGAASALGTLLDILGFVIPVAAGLLQLELLATIVRIWSEMDQSFSAIQGNFSRNVCMHHFEVLRFCKSMAVSLLIARYWNTLHGIAWSLVRLAFIQRLSKPSRWRSLWRFRSIGQAGCLWVVIDGVDTSWQSLM